MIQLVPARRWAAVPMLTVALLAGCSDDGGSQADGGGGTAGGVSIPPVETLPADDEGADLLARLAAAEDLTYHATYEGTGAAEEGEYVLEVHRDAGRIRQETVATTDAGEFRSLGILDGENAVLCQRPEGADWTCSEQAASETTARGVFGPLVAGVPGADVTAEDRQVEGEDVRCFTFDDGGGPSELCVADDGVLVTATTPAGSLRLVSRSDDVDPAVFEPPTPAANVQP